MKRYLIKQAVMIIPVLFLVSVIAFSLVRVFPSDVVDSYLKAHQLFSTLENVEMVRDKLGLDQSILGQYKDWLCGAIRFDFGISYYSNLKVSTIILMSLLSTLQLAAVAFVWTVLFSYLLGVYAAKKPNGVIDAVSRGISIVGNAVPAFVLGFLLIQVFALKLHWLPVSGKFSPAHVILPSITLSIGNICVYSRMLRNEMLDNIGKPYVLYAKVRGVRTSAIFQKHVLKNSLLPVVSTVGICFGHLIAGSVIVENVFAWPGMGMVITDAILSRNYPVIQGYIVCIVLIFIIVNLIADVLSNMLDPRIRLGKS